MVCLTDAASKHVCFARAWRCHMSAQPVPIGIGKLNLILLPFYCSFY